MTSFEEGGKPVPEFVPKAGKRQFGCVKVCCRGFAKNTGQLVTLSALADLCLASRRLLPLMGGVRP